MIEIEFFHKIALNILGTYTSDPFFIFTEICRFLSAFKESRNCQTNSVTLFQIHNNPY